MRLATYGRTLEPDPREQAAIAAARRLRAEGRSLRGIAAEMRRQGLSSRSETEFAPAAVRRMVAPEAAAGPRPS
jgi:hypothetical protein